ncbi:MAG TPA: glycosyl hydrolase [Oculatellaceae cyanobacterium]
MKSKRHHCTTKSIVLTALLSTSFGYLASLPAFGKKPECPVGVNVNSFQNFDPAQQETIVEQLKQSHVRFVRTSLRPDEKNMNLAKRLQDEGIGLVLVPGVECREGARQRPANDKFRMRAAMPLSATDVERSRKYYQTVFDKLDDKGVVLTAVELGNELNWADFNGDFPVPGQGKAFNFAELSSDPEAKQVAKGFLLYLKALAALKEVRDHSKLNQNTPIITCGMASAAGGAWQKQWKIDGVTIPATYAFLRAHGLDNLVDGYGVHTYPRSVKAGDKADVERRATELDETIFPANCDKPFWVTEWGFSSKANSSEEDKDRTRSVEEIRNYFHHLYKQGRLGGIFWYVWNEPDRSSIYRNGTMMEAGHKATASM